MRPEIKEEWVTALRSDEYEQGIACLHYADSSDGNNSKFCCLGVLCDLAFKAGVVTRSFSSTLRKYTYGDGDSTSRTHLPSEVMEWAGLTKHNPMVRVSHRGVNATESLSSLNDSRIPFRTIADIIEEDL